MPQNSQNEKNEKEGKERVSHKYRSPKTKKYFDILRFSPELPKEIAKVSAGYSPKTNTDVIEATDYFQELQQEQNQLIESLKKPIDERIREAQLRTGFNAANNLRILQEVAIAAKPRDKVAAIKTGTEITGERMPEQYDYNVTGDSTILTRLMQ